MFISFIDAEHTMNLIGKAHPPGGSMSVQQYFTQFVVVHREFLFFSRFCVGDVNGAWYCLVCQSVCLVCQSVCLVCISLSMSFSVLLFFFLVVRWLSVIFLVAVLLLHFLLTFMMLMTFVIFTISTVFGPYLCLFICLSVSVVCWWLVSVSCTAL